MRAPFRACGGGAGRGLWKAPPGAGGGGDGVSGHTSSWWQNCDGAQVLAPQSVLPSLSGSPDSTAAVRTGYKDEKQPWV